MRAGTKTSSAGTLVLLGPQNDTQTLTQTLKELEISGPIATVTAGWEEREPDDDELVEQLGGDARNLALHARAEELFVKDTEVRALLHERYDRLRELQALYRLRLSTQLAACRTLFSRTDPAEPDALHGPEITDSIAALRALDAHHLGRATQLDTEIQERLGDRDSIQRHVDALALTMEGIGALCIAGGHVGILLNRLRLFSVLELSGNVPVIAWSAGAMVLCERIVLFHDSPPQGAGDPEVYAPGLGLVRGIVPLPQASQRLALGDAKRVALFARRFAPDRCVALDGGERLCGSAGGTEWLTSKGALNLTRTGVVSEEVPA